MVSVRCWMQRLKPPGLVVLGNPVMQAQTVSGETEKAGGDEARCFGSGFTGYLLLRSCRAVGLSGHRYYMLRELDRKPA